MGESVESFNGGIHLHEEKIDMNRSYYGHPQGVHPKDEKMRIPLRSLWGVQAFYDRYEMTYQGLTFFAPPNGGGSAPPESMKYVIACTDGKLIPFGSELILLGGLTIIYGNINILRTGDVKSGQVIGTVKATPGYPYGVTMRAYGMDDVKGNRDGDIVRLEDYFYNLPYME